MNQASKSILWLLSLATVVSCRSLERFDARNGETYCGSLVGQGAVSTGFEQTGWEGKPVLSLTLNTAELYKRDGVPAIMTSNDAAFGPCTPLPLFDQAKVRTLGVALGDRLSAMRLNEDHDEDLVTYVDSTCSGSMVAILSLIRNGDVELRLLRPAPYDAGTAGTAGTAGLAAAPADATARFGLFALSKAKNGCGF